MEIISMRKFFAQVSPNILKTQRTISITEQWGPDNQQIEIAEICTPIRLNEETIGIIGLVAIDEKQKEILLDSNRRMVVFVEKMADMLAAKAAQKASLNDSEMMLDEITTILETTHEGIFAIDNKGYILRCNSMAEIQLGTTKEDIVGSHISRYMMGTPALAVLRSGVGYTENEEVYVNDRGKLHLIVTVKTAAKRRGDQRRGHFVP